MTRLIILGMTALLFGGDSVLALDLVNQTDRCQLDFARRDPGVQAVLTGAGISNLVCWHQNAKLLEGTSTLTKLIRNRTATFVDGTPTLDLAVAALAGYRLTALVRYWKLDRVFLTLVVIRPDPVAPEVLSQTFEISPHHYLAAAAGDFKGAR